MAKGKAKKADYAEFKFKGEHSTTPEEYIRQRRTEIRSSI